MSGEFMQTWLFDSLLVTTVLMGAVLLIRRKVARLFGPGVAYALWLIPAARLLMPSVEGAAVPVAQSGPGVSNTVRESILAGVSSPETMADTASKSIAAAVDLTALGVTFGLGGAALFFIIQMIRYASMRDDLLSEATEIASNDVAEMLLFGPETSPFDLKTGPSSAGAFEMSIYPNPVYDNFTLRTEAEILDWTLSNALGQSLRDGRGIND